MQIKLEILGTETVNYKDKNGKDASFDVVNCREASPATLTAPCRLSARDFPGLKAGQVVTVHVSDVRCGKLDRAVGIRGSLVRS